MFRLIKELFENAQAKEGRSVSIKLHFMVCVMICIMIVYSDVASKMLFFDLILGFD